MQEANILELELPRQRPDKENQFDPSTLDCFGF